MDPKQKLYLAPFQGITGVVYREVYSSYFPWIDKLYTPFFTTIHKQKSLDAKGNELAYTKQQGIPVVPQILSKDADEIIRFSNYCQEKGFKEINWNLGCPYPRVANKKRGSGMLPFPEMINEILEMVMPNIEIDFSIKCRLGYFSPVEILRLIPIFNQFQISELTLHARIGKQLYKGGVDTNSFKNALALSEVPTVYNGDIFSVADYEKYLAEFQDISCWMIGRGLLIDPFLPGDIKGIDLPGIEERKAWAKKFITELYLAYRKNKNDSLHSISVMKELWSNMSYAFNKPQKVFNAIKKTKSFDAYEDAVNHVFENFEWLGNNGMKFKGDN